MLLFVIKMAGSSSAWLDFISILEFIIDGEGFSLISTLLLTIFLTSLFFLLLDCEFWLLAFCADCLGDMLSTIFDGPATTSTLVMICFAAFDLGVLANLSSFLGDEAMTETELDATTGAEGLFFLSLSESLLGLIASGFTLVIVGGGGLVSIIFSCTEVSVFGGSGS